MNRLGPLVEYWEDGNSLASLEEVPPDPLDPEALGLPPLPPWVPVPVVWVATIPRHDSDWMTRLAIGDVLVETVCDDEDLARRSFPKQYAYFSSLSFTPVPLLVQVGEEIRVSPQAESEVSELVSAATWRLRLLVEDPPELRYRINPPHLWPFQVAAVWEAKDASGEWVELSDLSRAQQRWVRFAIHAALSRRDRPWERPVAARVAILDEPEMALHRNAERYLSGNLERLGETVLVATHSPVILSQHSNALHVTRDDTGRVIAAALDLGIIDSLDRSDADALGLSRLDLIQLYRVLALVEGDHDEIVLRARLAHELSEARAHIVRLSGPHALQPAADARYLFDLTDQPLLLVVDRIKSEVSKLWKRVDSLMETGSSYEAIGELLKSGFLDSTAPAERRAFATFMEAAVKQNRWSRIRLFELSEPDILCYLPISSFAPGFDSWTAAWTAYRSQEAGEASGLLFKRWLRKQGADLNNQRIAEVAMQSGGETNPDVPSELDRLAAMLFDLSRQVRIDQ